MHTNDTSSGVTIVVFAIAGHPYAIPTTRAREVIAWRRPRPLPGAENWVEGVINLRGEIIPVCDLHQALGFGTRPSETVDTSILVVEHGSEAIGLTVDQVRAVIEVDTSEMLDASAANHPALDGIVRHDGELVILLDPDAALGEGVEHLTAAVSQLITPQQPDETEGSAAA